MTALTGLRADLPADARILIVDLPSAADAARTLLPAYTVLQTEAPHTIAFEDLTPLQGADVLCWAGTLPDHQRMLVLAGKLAKLTDRVRIITPTAEDPALFHPGALELTSAELVQWARARAAPYHANGAAEAQHSWETDDDGSREADRAGAAGTPGALGHAGPSTDPSAETSIQASEHGADRGSGAVGNLSAGISGDNSVACGQNVERLYTGYPQSNVSQPNVKRGKPRTRRDGSNANGTDHPPPRVSWESLGLTINSIGSPHSNMRNATRVLLGHPELTGKIWFDDFHRRVYSTLFTPNPTEWSDVDDGALLAWIQDAVRFHNLGKPTVRDAVDYVARIHRRNELLEWLESLAWDGTERLPMFMADAFGAPQNDYTAAVGRCWLVSMVARIYRPGCKVDTMPVFEGYQGIGKSSALSIIGGKWFAEMHEDVNRKDFFVGLQGVWLAEWTELHAFRRAEVDRIKGIVSCQTDRFRMPFERRSADHPRQCVFGGTTNRDDWVQDDTGARRFWPIACGDINLEFLTTSRKQLFAEAVHRFKAGESWWNVDQKLAKHEQDKRMQVDEWTQPILYWASNRPDVTVLELLTEALGMKPEKQDKSAQMRVASILKVNRFAKRYVWRNGGKCNLWITPTHVKNRSEGEPE